jgi:hypothetical protein
MIKCEAFSASAGDLTLKHSLISNEIGGGCDTLSGEENKAWSSGGSDEPVIESSWATAESRVGRFVTESQDESVSGCPMKLRRLVMRPWRESVL